MKYFEIDLNLPQKGGGGEPRTIYSNEIVAIITLEAFISFLM